MGKLSEADAKDIQWEIEADREWDSFYARYGIDRSEMIRRALEPVLWPWHKRLRWWIKYEIIHPIRLMIRGDED